MKKLLISALIATTVAVSTLAIAQTNNTPTLAEQAALIADNNPGAGQTAAVINGLKGKASSEEIIAVLVALMYSGNYPGITLDIIRDQSIALGLGSAVEVGNWMAAALETAKLASVTTPPPVVTPPPVQQTVSQQ